MKKDIIGNGGSIGASTAKTAFNEVSVAQNFVQAGWSFPFSINPVQTRFVEISSGTVTHSGNFAVVSTGTAADGTAFIRTIAQLSYTPGIGALARFTAIFDTPQVDSLQLIGVGDFNDGWFFGYNGLEFGILRRAKTVDTWVTQGQWNKNTYPDLNHQVGNVYEIRFKWLGFGDQYFAIANASGDVEDVHQIYYSNQNLETSVDVASLPIAMGVGNQGNTTDIQMKSPSAIAFSQGEAFPLDFTTPIGYAFEGTLGVGSNYMFSILNPDTFQTKDNKLYIEPALLTFTNETNKSITVRVLFNAVLTNPVWVDVETAVTPAQFDESATAFTNGIEVTTFTVPRLAGVSFDVTSIFKSVKVWTETSVSFIADVTIAGDVTVGFTFRSRI